MSKKSRTRDKSFQPSAAGKGDGDRTTDVEAYRSNYDEINWGSPHQRELKNAYASKRKRLISGLQTAALLGVAMPSDAWLSRGS